MHPQPHILGEAQTADARPEEAGASPAIESTPLPPREIGGREGPDPTRYGDWEKSGRCIDF